MLNKMPKLICQVEYYNKNKFEPCLSQVFNQVYYYYDRYRKYHVYIIGSHPYCPDGHVMYRREYQDIVTVILEMLSSYKNIKVLGGPYLKKRLL